ncbi:MAG: hypothetical protein AB1Z65_09665 [Candidatus Sulfomarinibacteraceae bacterium]
MRPDELFGIDIAAEVATLCSAQLQGPWQVPAEFVRLANARGAARVQVDRGGRGLDLRFDGVLATRRDFEDLMRVMDDGGDRVRRQAAVSKMESAGLSVLLWATGLPGARLKMTVTSLGGTTTLSARAGSIRIDTDEDRAGPPRTTVRWRCRGLSVRRSVRWLRTATRFVPIPVTVFGRPVDRGFEDGLYRMRIHQPLAGELSVTASGETASLWLLENGVLSARAVVPGYPPFSAAVEMSGIVPAGSSADELRAAANPSLEGLIDEAARMLLMLVDRLPEVDEPVRARLSTLLLRFALRGIRSEQIMSSNVVRVRRGSGRSMESPLEVAGWARDNGGVLRTVDPGAEAGGGGRLVEATTEERALLADLLGVHVEWIDTGARMGSLVRLRSLARRVRQRARGLVGAPIISSSELTRDEEALITAWSDTGSDLRLCRGRGSARVRGSTVIVGRERPEVRAAAAVAGEADGWLYPIMLALSEDLEVPDGTRGRWLASLAAEAPRGAR